MKSIFTALVLSLTLGQIAFAQDAGSPPAAGTDAPKAMEPAKDAKPEAAKSDAKPKKEKKSKAKKEKKDAEAK